MTLEQRIILEIRDVADFPKPGILFKDITPLLKNNELCNDMVSKIKEDLQMQRIDAVAGIESRGFLIGVPLALALGVPFILIRKKGKLPFQTVEHKYNLEYGSATIEMQIGDVLPGQKVLIHDDLLATGGTAIAAAELIKKQKGEVVGFSFLVELSFLNAKKDLSIYSENISTLVRY